MIATADEVAQALEGLTDAVVVIGHVDEKGAVKIEEARPPSNLVPLAPIGFAIAQAWRTTKDGQP